MVAHRGERAQCSLLPPARCARSGAGQLEHADGYPMHHDNHSLGLFVPQHSLEHKVVVVTPAAAKQARNVS